MEKLRAKYEKEIQQLKSKVEKEESLRKIAEEELYQYKAFIMSKLQGIFNKDQISKLLSNKKWEWWTAETYNKSFRILFACGKTGYNFLVDELQWPLPSARSISRYLQTFKLTEGISEDIFRFLEMMMDSLNEKERESGILSDEMAITPGRRYDNSTQSFIGADHLKKALVFMQRGISTKWKFASSYKFTTGSSNAFMMKEHLFELIIKSEKAKMKVRFYSSDMGDDNVKLWTELGKKTKNSRLCRCSTCVQKFNPRIC